MDSRGVHFTTPCESVSINVAFTQRANACRVNAREVSHIMDMLRRLFGGSDEPSPVRGQPLQSEDARAVERYQYLLRTAPPDTLEEAHAEAFARLTPEQRHLVLQQLVAVSPEAKLLDASGRDDARALARAATRAEMRHPGTLERSFSQASSPGMGGAGLMAGNFMSTIAGVMVGSAIANAFFNDAGQAEGGGLAEGDPGAMGSGDGGSFDSGEAADIGSLGDFGGGDFGGGDF
jgi:hypothetical protein